jgi:hypothetical protein
MGTGLVAPQPTDIMALRSESVFCSLVRALDHLVGEHASPAFLTAFSMMHVYEICPRRDKHGANLISDALLFGRLWYTEIPHASGYAEFYSRSHDAVIRVFDAAGNVIETHEHAGEFKEW